MHTDRVRARKPLRTDEDFRAAIIRLNAWPAGLTLSVAAVILFWLPLQAAVLAISVPVFAAASAVLFMLVVHSRQLRAKPTVQRAATSQLACVAIAAITTQPVAEAIESLIAGPDREPTYWMYAVIPAVIWAGTAIRLLARSEREDR